MSQGQGEEQQRHAVPEAARKRAAVETYARHEAALRRTARRFSLCEDDAEDALQRALEILLNKAPSEDPRELVRWTQTVVRHEALAVRRERERILSGPAAIAAEPGREDWTALIPSEGAGPAERAERAEAVARSREALRSLKPQELRALSLLAEGYSYAEIGELTGFSRTKINRCLAEGRERFRRFLAGSESGERCAELGPLISAFCDGEAGAGEAAAVREHLRACPRCRATLRAYRAAPRAAAALAPTLPLGRSLLERAHDAVAGLAARFGPAGDSTVGGMASAGGSRGAGVAMLAKIAALCVGTAGGAAACVATGVVPAPLDPQHDEVRAARIAQPRGREVKREFALETGVDYAPETPLDEVPPAAVEPPPEPESKPAHKDPDALPFPDGRSAAAAGTRTHGHERRGRIRRSAGARSGEQRKLLFGGGGVPSVPVLHRRRQSGRRVRPMKRVVPLLLSALALAAFPAGAGADLGGLRVAGAQSGWSWNRAFNIEWDEFAADGVFYNFPGTAGNPGPQWQNVRTAMQVDVPAPPGAALPPPGEYVIEIVAWHREPDTVGPPTQQHLGRTGPSSFLTLRYDPSAPGAPKLTAPSRWFDAHAQIPISIDPPAYVPPSGVFGYAYAVSANRGELPCAAATFCAVGDLDLGGGTRHQLTLGPLPDGTSYLNVVAASGAGVFSPVASVPLYIDASPPAIRFAGVPGGWVSHPVTVTAVAEDRAAGMTLTGANGPFTALAIDGGPPTLAFGATVTATVHGEGTHLVSAWGRDLLGNANGGETTMPVTVRIDETEPRVAFANQQRPDEPELLEVTVADPLSGPSGERGSIEIRPAGTGQAFERLPTRTTATGLQARWSSDDYPSGSYEFRATAFDAAGNRALAERRANGTPMVLSNPVKVPTAIDSGYGGPRLVWQRCHRLDGERRRCRRETVTSFAARPTRRTVAYGRPLRFGGVLHTVTGTPLAGFPVEIVETFASGADVAQRRTTVTSRGDGRFEALLVPGPSRRVEAFFAGTKTLTRTTGRQVTMAVRAGVRFAASTSAARIGGKPVVFRGRLRAGEATIRRTGRPIRLEFRLPGGEWSEFRTVQTDRHGRFRYPYAFTDDDSRGIRFQFRAVSPDQADFPYRPAASAPVAVTGY